MADILVSQLVIRECNLIERVGDHVWQLLDHDFKVLWLDMIVLHEQEFGLDLV